MTSSSLAKAWRGGVEGGVEGGGLRGRGREGLRGGGGW